MAIISRFTGDFDATQYAYGINPNAPAALQVTSGSGTAGTSYTLTCRPSPATVNPNLAAPAPTTTTPITIGSGSQIETVTPSAVSTDQLGNLLITATFTNAHGVGDQIRSGTVGLQEALNACGAYGGGSVTVDAAWVVIGGTQAMLVAATYPAKVGLLDNRFGANYSNYTYTLTNTQILNMSTTAVELLPPPGAASYWQVQAANLVNLCTGTAYTAGSAITIGYSTTATPNALSGTIAAGFLTSQTTQTVIEVGSGLTSSTAATTVLNKGIYITNSTTAFATGTGTLQVCLQVADINT